MEISVPSTSNIKHQVSKATSATEKQIHWFARVGFIARAFIYALMGIFAVLLFTGQSGGAATDSQGSIKLLLEQGWGKPLIITLAVGLLAYAVFRMLQAFLDSNDKGSDFKGLGLRAGYLLGGLLHIALAYYALSLVFEFKDEGGSGSQGLAQTLMSLPAGRLLLFALGAGVVAFGIGQLVIAFKEKFMKGLDLPSRHTKLLKNISKFGIMARGLMLGAVGWLFILASWSGSSAEARGVKGAWSFFGTQPFGTWVELIIAIGLIAFAIYGVVESRYRQVGN